MNAINIATLNFKSKNKTIENSRLDFHKTNDLNIDEITFLDDKVAIGRAPGSPQYLTNTPDSN